MVGTEEWWVGVDEDSSMSVSASRLPSLKAKVREALILRSKIIGEAGLYLCGPSPPQREIDGTRWPQHLGETYGSKRCRF